MVKRGGGDNFKIQGGLKNSGGFGPWMKLCCCRCCSVEVMNKPHLFSYLVKGAANVQLCHSLIEFKSISDIGKCELID